jgi:hypothetical protein
MPLQLGPSANTEETRLSTQESAGDTPIMDASETQQPTQGGWLDQFRAENSMLPNILMGVGMIVVVFVMIRSLRKTHKSNAARANAMGSPSERIEEIRHRAITSMEPAEKLMVEAEEIARRLGAALDNKAARLELLIEEADAKLDQLNRAISNQTKPAHTNDSSEPTPAARPAPRSIDPSLLDRARLEQDQHEREARVAGRIEPTNAEPEPAEIPISDQIQELALKGKSPHEIAHQLKQPIGQVELILNLQRRAERS